MSRVRKYLEGETLSAMQVFHEIAMCKYVLENGRPMHPGFMGSRMISDVIEKARRGHFKEALINPDHPDYEKGTDNG
jgi:hypothetical protein